MTKPKRAERGSGYSPSAAYLKTPMCTLQLACDGDNLNIASRERGYCGKCAEAAKKRGKVLPMKKGKTDE
jgi:hypothetical protein